MKSIINFFKKILSKKEKTEEIKNEDNFCEVVKKEKTKSVKKEKSDKEDKIEKKAPAKRIKRNEN